MVDAVVAFEGWSRSQGWGLGPFGTGAIDIGVATGSVGTVTVAANADVSVTGVSATGSVGTVTLLIDTPVSVTGVSATGSVGNVTVA